MSTFNPNWASKPGNTILNILDKKNISKEEFVKRMCQPVDIVYGLIYSDVIISDELALKLSEVLGVSKQFWLNRQERYQNSLLSINKIDEMKWAKDLPYNEMVSLGWIGNDVDKRQSCLDFFGVKSVSEWAAIYNSKIGGSVSFRTSASFNSKLGPLTCWLRKGEVVGNSISCNEWNQEQFHDSLNDIKKLTREKNPEKFIPKLKEICAASGVAVAIVRAPKGCRASGATSFISPNKALMILSFRHRSDDHFWFTFFHEAGHLILHKSKSFHVEGIESVEGLKTDVNKELREAEANDFAADWLMNKELRERMFKIKRNKRSIIAFAMEAGVSPGIVVAQMQYYDCIKKEYLNDFKRRYSWDDIDRVTD